MWSSGHGSRSVVELVHVCMNGIRRSIDRRQKGVSDGDEGFYFPGREFVGVGLPFYSSEGPLVVGLIKTPQLDQRMLLSSVLHVQCSELRTQNSAHSSEGCRTLGDGEGTIHLPQAYIRQQNAKVKGDTGHKLTNQPAS